MKRRVGVVGVAVAVLAGAAGACSSGDDDGGGGGGDGLGDPGGDLAGELEALPLPAGDDGEVVTVAFGDLARAAELAGIDLPAAGAGGGDERFDALNAITGVRYDPEADQHPVGALAPEAAHIERLTDVDEFTAEVGWNVFGVQRFVELLKPPEDVTVMRGDFDESALTDAMGEPEDGVWVLGRPGEIVVSERSAARPIGEALWLSLSGDRLIVAKTEEGLAAARGEGGDTVGGDPVFADLADTLDAADAYSGLLLRGSFDGLGVTARLTPEQAEEACEDALPGPFAGVGVGITDDDGPVFVIAYVTPDEGAAAATAEAVERIVGDGRSVVTGEPWSERLTVDEVSADGNVAVARLRPAEPGPAALWRQLGMQRDNLVAHC